MHFYKLFELKYVLAECVHSNPTMIKIHPVFYVLFCFINLVKSFPLSQIEPFSDACLCDVTQTGPSHDSLIDSSVSAQTGFVSNLTHPEWAVISPPLFHRRSRCTQEWLLIDWSVLLLDVIMNIMSSRHLLLTSEPLKTQWITFILEGNSSSHLPKCVYLRANHSWSRLRIFNESLQITFPNNILLSKLPSHRERLGREGRGEQSLFVLKAAFKNTAWVRRSCFWQGKDCVVLHYHWDILNKLCYRLFMKTLKNQMCIRWPL